MANRREEEDGLLLTAIDGRQLNGSSSTATGVLVFSTTVAVCGSFVYGSAVGFSSPAQTGIMDDLGLSLEEYSVFGSILTIGAMIGAVMSGKIADKFGRRRVSWLLDAGRLLIGYGIGVISYVVPVYIAEITPQNLRGAFTTVNQLMISTGISVMWLIGILIPWRTLALIGTVPCLLQILGLFFIPESPRWLAKIGRWKDIESTLQRLRGENAEISEEAAEIKDYTETLNQLSETRVFDLFQPEYAKSLIVGVGLMVLQQFGGVNAIAFYANSIFISAGFSSSIGSIALALVQVPCTLLGVLLMDVSGRRPLLMVVCSWGFHSCSRIFKKTRVKPILALVGVLVFKSLFSLGMGGIPWVIMSEIFPINIKSSAGSLVTLVNWFGSWIVSYSFNFLMKCSTAVMQIILHDRMFFPLSVRSFTMSSLLYVNVIVICIISLLNRVLLAHMLTCLRISIHDSGTFFMFSSVCFLTILFVAKLVPETKGRSLEEIQASMNPLMEN
ncbi:hypothetical protein OSB04_001036 [Centaurea solstitialis]|uniref:Major facilitator superfamily (MFS) profile domain-containing protein n=1 Tax=Centaurea solstitialis TaxID=347529 RepID=A0AA38WSF9_9ASTR|nr:hypothetical protein OSB04_001036 [Centaurea solstitialis]